jgi:hypothetical protein
MTPTVIKHSDELYKDNCFIHTQAGRWKLDFPHWDIPAMAHALGQLARYNGHADKFYSVAEHSVLVSLLMQELRLGDPLEGLLHDGTEAFLSDIPSPFKHRLPDWRAIEKRLDRQMREHFGLNGEKTAGCVQADWLALFIEAMQIVPGRGEDFEDPHNFRKQAAGLRAKGWHVACNSWTDSRAIFMLRFQELSRGRVFPFEDAPAARAQGQS